MYPCCVLRVACACIRACCALRSAVKTLRGVSSTCCGRSPSIGRSTMLRARKEIFTNQQQPPPTISRSRKTQKVSHTIRRPRDDKKISLDITLCRLGLTATRSSFHPPLQILVKPENYRRPRRPRRKLVPRRATDTLLRILCTYIIGFSLQANGIPQHTRGAIRMNVVVAAFVSFVSKQRSPCLSSLLVLI